MAVAYKTIYDSVGMVTGGFSGISIIVRRLTEYLKDYSYVKIQESSVPDGMQQGGVHIVYYLINNIIPSGGVPIWFTNISLNIPLFICAYKERGKAFLRIHCWQMHFLRCLWQFFQRQIYREACMRGRHS